MVVEQKDSDHAPFVPRPGLVTSAEGPASLGQPPRWQHLSQRSAVATGPQGGEECGACRSTPRLPAVLAAAARAAGHAPSIHNTQPWRWRVGATLDLYADRARQLAVTDPEGRLLTAQLRRRAAPRAGRAGRRGLAGRGDPAARTPPTRICWPGWRRPKPIPVEPAAVRLLQTMSLRHTDRRPVTDAPVDRAAVARVALRRARGGGAAARAGPRARRRPGRRRGAGPGGRVARPGLACRDGVLGGGDPGRGHRRARRGHPRPRAADHGARPRLRPARFAADQRRATTAPPCTRSSTATTTPR